MLIRCFIWIFTLSLLGGPLCAAEVPAVDPRKPYKLEELIDLAERTHPRTRLAWERVSQRAAELGIARSDSYPVLAAVVLGSNQHIINPFPKPLAPNGYTMVDLPTAAGALKLEYVLFDFGHRAALVDAAKTERLAADAAFFRETQSVAFDTAQAYYNLLTAEERMQATTEILATARTTQTAAEAQLANGRATLPDVLNARAATAQAVYDHAVAEGDQRIARVELREALGVTPSEEISIDHQLQLPEPDAVSRTVEDLVRQAMRDRPDLEELAQQIHAADAGIRAVHSTYRPSVTAASEYGQTALWPLSDYGSLGSASRITWSAELKLNWTLFDGGRRHNELLLAESKQRAAKAELQLNQDHATREVWSSYLRFQTAVRRREAAESLLQAADMSYAASLEAYQYGVKNLIDVVTAEKQLSEARLAHVEARSELLLSAVSLQYTTGTLLRAPATGRAVTPNN
jgi:outer membrane protein TolC